MCGCQISSRPFSCFLWSPQQWLPWKLPYLSQRTWHHTVDMRRTPTEGECDYHAKGAHVQSLAEVLSDIILVVSVSHHDCYTPGAFISVAWMFAQASCSPHRSPTRLNLVWADPTQSSRILKTGVPHQHPLILTKIQVNASTVHQGFLQTSKEGPWHISIEMSFFLTTTRPPGTTNVRVKKKPTIAQHGWMEVGVQSSQNSYLRTSSFPARVCSPSCLSGTETQWDQHTPSSHLSPASAAEAPHMARNNIEPELKQLVTWQKIHLNLTV